MPFSIRPYRRFLKLPMAYISGFWLLITLLVLSSGPAYAEWVRIDKTEDGQTTYADPGTIRRNGDLVKMWYLLDYETSPTVSRVEFLSIKTQNVFDCVEDRTQTLSQTWFAGRMGSGKVIHSTDETRSWILLAPESVGLALWKIACGKP